MSAQIIGISGSPIKNSNTDRLIKAVLASSGLESEFVKLSDIEVRPCIACLGCAKDNICKVRDDFPALAGRIKEAGAVVVGGYSPYATVDGFTKAFLDRLFSFRHRTGLNRGRLAVVVSTGIGRGLPGMDQAALQIAAALGMEGMEVLGTLKATGNPECLVCGFGEECPMSALPWVFGQNPQVTPDKFRAVEDQAEVMAQAAEFGKLINERLRAVRAM